MVNNCHTIITAYFKYLRGEQKLIFKVTRTLEPKCIDVASGRNVQFDKHIVSITLMVSDEFQIFSITVSLTLDFIFSFWFKNPIKRFKVAMILLYALH